ncbi:hypothetical protein P153DRAFT_365551 [Dothidotthia symphoricarpi CBS 119687]|uniref:Uncharacterized protein n=1 Tax=Dothidotthia symphoricarpi CBS 119687 TaxID=1392245 RepID=A0A6A6AH94_9PLEO|nr:uncharacterized protein P153DRAFT_365551 [Dothidotthia symphoricarpi CBS 119687]KAF2130926.1 hypothetical protein P153DRAFT_365551 [Dothidotthia symphoricarpi CBS 119687]
MKSIFSLLARQQLKTFKVNYAPEYKTFIIHHVCTDQSHPLNEAQRRRQREWKKEGLWWHATTGVDLSKSSCVRAWARRRLRNAVTEELKARGYDEKGKPLDGASVKGKSDLTGSLRLHAQLPLLPATYVDVKEEVGKVLDMLLEGAKEETRKPTPGKKNNDGHPHRKSSGTPPQFRIRRTNSDNIHS